MTRVFVYGTLKRGGENHEWLAGQRFLGAARTLPQYRMFDLGGHPGMIIDEQGIAIEGEVWEVDEAALTRLDVLEDIESGEYERVPVLLDGGFGSQRVEGYIYLRCVDGRGEVGACW